MNSIQKKIEIKILLYKIMRRNSNSGEVKERLRRFFVRPRYELHEDILMPQVSLGRRFWNMINP